MEKIKYKKTTGYFREDLFRKMKVLSAKKDIDMKDIYNQAIEEFFKKNSN